jgi:hypothetical protein
LWNKAPFCSTRSRRRRHGDYEDSDGAVSEINWFKSFKLFTSFQEACINAPVLATFGDLSLAAETRRLLACCRAASSSKAAMMRVPRCSRSAKAAAFVRLRQW